MWLACREFYLLVSQADWNVPVLVSHIRLRSLLGSLEAKATLWGVIARIENLVSDIKWKLEKALTLSNVHRLVLDIFENLWGCKEEQELANPLANRI